MKNLFDVALWGLLTATLFGAPAALAENGDKPNDASFEEQLTAAEGGWQLFEISMYSRNYARSGSQSMFNGGFSRTVPFQATFIGNASGAFQEFPAEAGSRWRLTGYGLTPATLEGTTAFGIVQVSFFDVGGKDLGSVETAGTKTKAKTSAELNRTAAVGEWIFLDTGIATAPEGTATIQAFTLFVDYSGSERAQGVYFDDLSLCELGEDGDARCDPD
ncbi:MAG: hypothetical protein QNJ14_06860 [Woeseiaceae bacterium]|nr:hypothetical protein [Woeseiaceae bacterium]